MINPILTIGITTYERPASLKRAVGSVFEQRGVLPSEVEVIVVDDASPSQAAEAYLSALSNYSGPAGFPLRVIRHDEGSGGPSTGRNDIIKVATGNYLLFLDDDNLIAPDSLSPLVDYLRSSPMDWVSLRRCRNGKSFFRSPEGRHANLSRRDALWTFLICGAFQRSTINALELGFDPEVSYGEDNEFVLEFVTKANAFAALSDRDYVIESDPASDELPHISHLPPGVDFVRTLVAHVGRLSEIVARSSLDSNEKTDIAKLILIRSIGSYKLDRKIARLKDDGDAQELLAQWSALLRSTLTAEQVETLAARRGKQSILRAIISRDLDSLRAAVAAAE